VKGTINYQLTYGTINNNKLVGYADADYAADIDDRKSVSGYVFILNGGAISWS